MHHGSFAACTQPDYPVAPSACCCARTRSATSTPCTRTSRCPTSVRYVPVRPAHPRGDGRAGRGRSEAHAPGEARATRCCSSSSVADTGEVIGDVVLLYRSEVHRSGEIGYIFNPAHSRPRLRDRSGECPAATGIRRSRAAPDDRVDGLAQHHLRRRRAAARACGTRRTSSTTSGSRASGSTRTCGRSSRTSGERQARRRRGRRAGPRCPRCRPTAGSARRAPRAVSPATLACVIRCGCSISDSTPPSDSPSVKTSVRLQTLSAVSSPSRTVNEIIPPKPRVICRAAMSCPGCGREARVVDALDRRVRAEEVGDADGVGAVPVHPYAEGLDAAQHEPGVEGAGDRAHRVLVERQQLADLGVGGDERAADHVRVAAEVLRRRVHDDVGAERERLLQVRRRERVVDDQAGAGVPWRSRRARRCRRCRAAGWWASRTTRPSCSGGRRHAPRPGHPAEPA